MQLYPKLITDALEKVIYPGTKKNLVESEMLADSIRIDGNKVSFTLIFPRDTDPFMQSTIKAAEAQIHYSIGEEVEVTIHTEFRSAKRPEPGKMLPQVKNVIAVSSGKGGVGKSTVSVNLAISLAKLGYKVGILDTDIFGPSLPKMFGVEGAPIYSVEKDGRQLIEPLEKYGVKLLSIGFFVNPETATLWRGGMASNALKQLNDKVNVPILGLVENMAWFTPKELPENKYFLFGKDGCKNLAKEMELPLLAQIPIVQGICESGDEGVPAAVNTESIVAQSFLSLAQSVVTVVNRRNARLPKTKIVEVNNK